LVPRLRFDLTPVLNSGPPRPATPMRASVRRATFDEQRAV